MKGGLQLFEIVGEGDEHFRYDFWAVGNGVLDAVDRELLLHCRIPVVGLSILDLFLLELDAVP